MSLKTYLIILKTGIYLSFISVGLVFSNLLFPYITSKQLYFNVLMEILAVVWLAAMMKYPAIRPKKSWITFGLAGFFGALLVSSFFGVDFNMSFWGNIERMLGWFQVIHFFLFYLIVITVFRGSADWRNLFIVSVSAAMLVCLYALIKTPLSTIGNTAYVSGYAIFNVYFALILFFRGRAGGQAKNQDWFSGALYLAAIFILLAVMSVTRTRGAYVGLGVSLFLFFILFARQSREKIVKILSFGGLALAAAAVVLVFSFPQSALVKSSSIFNTLTQISSSAVTFQTRLISWKSALKDFPNHPLLGTGYGNYAITFDKYFDPSFYSYTSSETYFDRAHNNLIDIASTTGLLGIITYLSIFAAVLYYLYAGKKSGRVSGAEFILLSCLFIAYFIQNLAVFDSLVTYISLMLALGYVYWLVNEEEELPAGAGLTDRELMVLAVAGLAFFLIIYQYNFKPFLMLNATINGQLAFARGDAAGGFAAYHQAMGYETPLDRDSRKSLINLVNGNAALFNKLAADAAEENLKFTVKLAEDNVKYNPADSMMEMQLAQTYNTAAMFYADNQQKFSFYSKLALEAVDKAIAASPGRITVYFTKAQIYLTRGDKDNAVKTLKYAAALNQRYAEPVCYLAKAALYFKDEAEGYAAMDKCLDLGGAGNLSPLELVKIALNHYQEKKDQPKILALSERWSALEPGEAKVWIRLSLLYEQSGDTDKAAAAAEKAAALDPSLKASAQEFIRKLKGE